MSGGFKWEENGLSRGRFEALAKLVRLTHHGQVELPTRFDETHLDINLDENPGLDNDSTAAMQLTDFGTNHLQRLFLDRLAELVSNEKGGRHVTATMMSIETDSIHITVARNSKFRPQDEGFLQRLQSLLRLIAMRSDGSSKDAIWAAMLKHYEARIQHYIVDLRQLLKRYAQTAKESGPQVAESSLASRLGELGDAVFKSYTSTEARNEALVLEAHSMFKTFSMHDFADTGFPTAHNLRNTLGFLGRLRSSFSVLVRAAERLEGVTNIEISSVCSEPLKETNDLKNKAVAKVEPWTLTQLFDHFGYSLTDAHVETLMGSPDRKARWNKSKLAREFAKLKSSTCEVHAEIQLLPHFIQASARGEMVVPYIGCSKHSCFLCWHFLDILGGIRTRGCHGKLYHLWGLPGFDGITPAAMDKIVKSVQSLEILVKLEIVKEHGGSLQQAKESTIGPSSIRTVAPGSSTPSLMRTVVEYLENQRLNLLFPANTSEERAYDDAFAAPMVDHLTLDAPTTGPCGNCGNSTSRRCSYCSGSRFCSTRCEDEGIYSHKFQCNRVPITTADILERDCFQDILPQDPQVREDYGFNRCRNSREETNLFGLYVGVIKYHGISSQELHRWRVERVLIQKIIGLFSAMPEKSRGGYYPWFLRNRHVLDTSYEVVREDDDPHAYIERMFAKARPYLEPGDLDTPVQELSPFAKNYYFHFFPMLVDGKHPPPSMPHLDLWYDFGFVVCNDTHEETTLANIYQWLLLGNQPARDHFESLGMDDNWRPPEIPTCRFNHFWRAWEAGTLMDLFDQYGTSQGQASYGQSLDFRFPALREFMSYPGKYQRPSVWRLRQYLAIEATNILTLDPEIAMAAQEYGFRPILDVRTTMDLRDFYTGIFKQGVLPAQVHHVAAEGRLQEVADEWSGTKIEERIKEVLRGVPYGPRFDNLAEEDPGGDEDIVVNESDDDRSTVVEEQSEEQHCEGGDELGQVNDSKGWCSIQ